MYTPNGLKIRIDENDIRKVLGNSYEIFDFDQIGIQVESWERFPRDFALVTTVLMAAVSNNLWLTIFTLIISYTVGSLIQNLTYSKILSSIFANFLCRPIICLVLIISSGLFLIIEHNNTTLAIIQAVLALLCLFGIVFLILEPFMFPIALWLEDYMAMLVV